MPRHVPNLVHLYLVQWPWCSASAGWQNLGHGSAKLGRECLGYWHGGCQQPDNRQQGDSRVSISSQRVYVYVVEGELVPTCNWPTVEGGRPQSASMQPPYSLHGRESAPDSRHYTAAIPPRPPACMASDPPAPACRPPARRRSLPLTTAVSNLASETRLLACLPTSSSFFTALSTASITTRRRRCCHFFLF